MRSDGGLPFDRVDSFEAIANLLSLFERLGREFSHPEVASLIADSPKQTADAMADIILAGLVSE